MSEHTLYEDKNDKYKDSSAPNQPAAFEPATLNLRKLETLQRFFQYGAGLLFLVFVILIVISVLELKSVNREIEKSKSKLELQQESMNYNQKKIDSQKNIITAGRNDIDEFYKVVEGYKKKDSLAATDILNKIRNEVPQTSDQNLILPRIYLHISREDQRSHAAAIGKQLETNGFIVPGIERVNPVTVSDLRYFESNDITKTDLQNINAVLQNISKVSVKPKQLSGSNKVRPRHYEIWFGEDFQSYPR